MASEYFEHVTATGDRWDLLAFDYYGDAKLIAPLLLANPSFVGDRSTPTPLVLGKGIKLRIPVLPIDEIEQAQLPPWKRK